MPNDNVRMLHTTRPINTDAIARLESALEKARSGEVVSVAIATVKFDGATNTAYSSSENVNTLLGGVEILRARILTSVLRDMGDI